MIKKITKRTFPVFYYFLYRIRKNRSDLRSLSSFMFDTTLNIAFAERLKLIYRFCVISSFVKCAHTESEILDVVKGMLTVPSTANGCFVEAGCFKGASAAKFSLIAKMLNRKLILFDSFEGIPENDELNPDGSYHHAPGIWKGTLEEVKVNISKFGFIEVCEFRKGLFDDTMPLFRQPVAGCYIDVDLASSTKACLKFLYPLVVDGGVVFSQDGHLKQVQEVFKDENFWTSEVGYKKPTMRGLGKGKIIAIRKNESDRIAR